MSFSESFTTRGDVAATGRDPMPGSFAGQARDLPAPLEFPSVQAVQILATRSNLPSLSGIGPPERESLPLVPANPIVQAETAFSLQDLATALARPPVVRTALPAAPDRADFSLTALAEQLQSRFTHVDREAESGVDLLTPPSMPAPAPAFHPLRKFIAPSVPKQATTRQGDVFFMEPPDSALEAGKIIESDKMDLFGEVPGEDLMDEVDSSDEPDSRAARPAPVGPSGEFLTVPPPRSGAMLPPPLRAPLTIKINPEPTAESGVGLVLAGAALVVLGIYFACLLPAIWLRLEEADAWTRQKNLAALVLHAAAALFVLTLGTGSVMSRRWAPPLIHAAGWVAIFTVSGIIAATGFHLVNADEAAPVPDTAGLIGLAISLLIPLGCIFYYQQESTVVACEASDPTPCWTDGMPVPALMVFVAGLALATGAAAMLCHRPAFPIAMESILTGPPAIAAWAGLGVLGMATAILVRLKSSAPWWLLLITAVALAATLSPGALAQGPVWENLLDALGRPTAAGPAAAMVPLLTFLIPAPLLLILAMARRAFSSPPPP